jgi:DNA-binding NtrC family response regulator
VPIQILVLDDEKIVGERLKASLEKEDHTLEIFINPVAALNRIREKTFDVVITDIRMDDVDGLQVLEEVRKKSLKTKVIMITGYATLEVARESLTKGAFDFIAKPFKLKEIHGAIKKAEEALQAEES